MWEDNGIQFPRLLAEIEGMGLTDEQWEYLKVEMGLTDEELAELFGRAQDKWDAIKEAKRPNP